MSSLVIFSTIVATAIALRCYDETTTFDTPEMTSVCPVGTTQCYKQVKKGILNVFGCDRNNNPAGSICYGITNGTCRNQTVAVGFVTTCCCNTNLCNGGSFSSPPPTIPPKSAGLFQPLAVISMLVIRQFV